MNKISATEAKQSLGMLLDTVQHKPIEIQRQGRGVAVILSMEEYLSLKGEKTKLGFLCCILLKNNCKFA